MMRIKEITEEEIIFTNGKSISYTNFEWYANNYPDFQQLDDLGRSYNFSDDLKFEKVDDCGFRFGDDHRMFFIPCYSKQNGYYSSEVDIYYDNELVLTAEGEIGYK